ASVVLEIRSICSIHCWLESTCDCPELFQAVRPMLYNSGDISVKAMLRLPEQYAVVSALVPSPARFPMAHGQRDFA
ncbi:MAG: hypothetical protein ACP5O7_13305, partial [Phycisphaerae bacterium]